ncbi:MAG TPA: helix-turn-helix domain-containing protein [Candidatus Tectomicrobia bacterium]
MMDDPPSVPVPLLGERVRRIREARSMSQATLAAQMAMPPSWVAEVEMGQHPQLDGPTLARFCQVFAVSEDYLLGHIDSPRPLYAPDMHRHTETPHDPSRFMATMRAQRATELPDN